MLTVTVTRTTTMAPSHAMISTRRNGGALTVIRAVSGRCMNTDGHPYGRPHDHLERAHRRHDTFQPEDVPAERNKGHIGADVFDQHHPAYQKPQAPEDRQAPDYDNDVPVTEWTRAGTHPHFDSGPSGHRYRK
jgi:hypothetical protein